MRSPAVAAWPATAEWALAFQREVRLATAAAPKPIESVVRKRASGAPRRAKAPRRAAKAARRTRAGTRRSARAEIQKSPTLLRRCSRETYPATKAAAASSAPTKRTACRTVLVSENVERREDEERVQDVREKSRRADSGRVLVRIHEE
jgi:hypothetical protein